MLRQKKKKLLGNLHKFTELNLLSGEKKSKQNTTPKGEHRFLKITFSTVFFFFFGTLKSLFLLHEYWVFTILPHFSPNPSVIPLPAPPQIHGVLFLKWYYYT